MYALRLALAGTFPLLCLSSTLLAQGNKTYPVTSYRITRYNSTVAEGAYIELKNGSAPVAYMYFQPNPPAYGYHSTGSDYVTKAFDKERFDDIVGILRNERVQNVYGSWDDQNRVTFFILNSNSQATLAGPSNESESLPSNVTHEVPEDFKAFEVRKGVLRIKE